MYSLYALNGLLPAEHRAYWWLFVKGCRLLCRRTINTAQCKAAHSALVEFCKLFEQVNGKQRLVINMHLSCHLLPCLLDYGPVYSFWCFSFERFNGILESFPTNNRDITITMMKRFQDDLQLDYLIFTHILNL